MPCTEESKNMVNRNFRFNIFLRLGIVLVLMGLLSYYLFVAGKYIRSFYFGFFILALIFELLWYVDKRNRELTTFLSTLLNDDFSSRIKDYKKGKTFKSLYQAMNLITDKFHKLSTDREVQFQYLHTLVDHVKVGILSYDSKGRVHLVNKAFRELFGLPPIRKNSMITELGTEFYKLVEKIKPGEQFVYKVSQKGINISLAIRATEFKMKNKRFKLISAQNIRRELEERELEAWQKLIRVLTHEIMNSVTPISSLSSSLYELVKIGEEHEEPLDDKTKQKLQSGLEAIINRSSGLMKFTEAYKTLARIPPPDINPIQSDELIHRIEILFKTQTKEKNIDFKAEALSKTWSFLCDIELLDMVFINLMKNSMEALENTKEPQIRIRISKYVENKTLIEVKDNGAGMSEEIMSQIFIPFYTTKQKGSGIGLSLSNQIIRAHGGTIAVDSKPGKGSIFTIVI